MTDTHEGEQHTKRETLWVTDAEITRRLGAPEKIAYQAIRALDENKLSGFPTERGTNDAISRHLPVPHWLAGKGTSSK